MSLIFNCLELTRAIWFKTGTDSTTVHLPNVLGSDRLSQSQGYSSAGRCTSLKSWGARPGGTDILLVSTQGQMFATLRYSVFGLKTQK